MSDNQDNLNILLQKLDELSGRVAELERRVTELEGQGEMSMSAPSTPPPANFKMMPAAPAVPGDELLVAIGKALDELGGLGDAGTIRTQLAKSGMISVTRSDVNKALYAHKELFTIAQQDGMKPIWKRA